MESWSRLVSGRDRRPSARSVSRRTTGKHKAVDSAEELARKLGVLAWAGSSARGQYL